MIESVSCLHFACNAYQLRVSSINNPCFVSQPGAEVFLSNSKNNPLRSFHSNCNGTIRMGKKFFEVLQSVIYFSRIRLLKPAPVAIHYSKIGYPSWSYKKVERNTEIETLILSTKKMLEDIKVLNSLLGQNLVEYIDESLKSHRGISWQLWEQCLLNLVRNYDNENLSILEKQILEQLFLSRVVGHYFEILGTDSWYETIENQAASLFNKRGAFWVH